MPSLVSRTQLENASADAIAASLFVNGLRTDPNPGNDNGTITSRLGNVYPNLDKLIYDITAAPPSGWMEAFEENEALRGPQGNQGVAGPNAPRATSTTSNTVGTGVKTWNIDPATQFAIGQFAIVAKTSAPDNYMYGQITAYSAGALQINVTDDFGSGTHTDWTISLGFLTTGSLSTSGGTMSGPLITAASIAGAAGFNIPSGTAPTSPNTGDMWLTSNNLFFRGAANRQIATVDGTETLTNKTLTSPTVNGGVASNLVLTSPQINNPAGTFQYIFAGSAIVADRTITLPLLGSDDTIVFAAATQTLANKTFTSPVINGADINGAVDIDGGATVNDVGTVLAYSVGFRGIPQNPKTAAYQLIAADNGKHIIITTGGITIPKNAVDALPIGFACVLINDSGSNQNISLHTDDTLRIAGTTTTGGTRVMGARAKIELLKVKAQEWYISGAGLS